MKQYSFDYTQYREKLIPILQALSARPEMSDRDWKLVLRQYPKTAKEVFAKDELIQALHAFTEEPGLELNRAKVMARLQRKPTRSMSGVTPVTVLTKPFPCPGKCIFCPNDIRMPKSYLADEPGAQRAERNNFDPYLQTYNRVLAFQNTGHPVAKVEFIVLGGTWSYYPEAYQIWFVRECFRALNDFAEGKDDRERIVEQYQRFHSQLQKIQDSRGTQEVPNADPEHNKAALASQQIDGNDIHKTYNQTVSDVYVAPERLAGIDAYQSASWEELFAEHLRNEKSLCRNVGLVIETRPDNISLQEVLRIRKLGCTKTQIGFQSLNDDVLSKNKRGHDVAATRRAVRLLRQAGFKIHAHWMPNLYGSSVAEDIADYEKMFADPDFCPDELKIYPCSLIGSAELMQYYQKGLWKPYDEAELMEVLTACFRKTPEYCRLTRVIRDIPSTDIVVGNKKTNFREMAEKELLRVGDESKDIRAREIRGENVTLAQLQLTEVVYETAVSTELFLQYVTEKNKIAGFLRLSLPKVAAFVEELKDSAMVREVHVYGQSLDIGAKSGGKAQHLGLGTLLLKVAKEKARAAGFAHLAVISAVGTREYYRQRGFVDGELYQRASLLD